MHANNEIGNLLDIERVGELCESTMPIFIQTPFKLLVIMFTI